MDFSTVSLFGLMKAKLSYSSERQALLAQNIANADTPNYRAMDIAEPDFKKMIVPTRTDSAHKLPGKAHMTLTNPMHINKKSAVSGMYEPRPRETTAELNPNGNNVSIEEETAQIAHNQIEYMKVLNLYGKTIAMFKTAIGRNGA